MNEETNWAFGFLSRLEFAVFHDNVVGLCLRLVCSPFAAATRFARERLSPVAWFRC